MLIILQLGYKLLHLKKKAKMKGMRNTEKHLCTSTCSNTKQSPLVFNSLFLPIYEHHIKPFRGWWTKITLTQSPWTTLDYPKELPKNRLPPKKTIPNVNNWKNCYNLGVHTYTANTLFIFIHTASMCSAATFLCSAVVH